MYKETIVCQINKEVASSVNDDSYVEYFKGEMSKQLGNKIMEILEAEDEIIVTKPELRIRDDNFINSIEYKKTISWQSVATCQHCENWQTDWVPGSCPEGHYCEALGILTKRNFFCSSGKRRESEKIH